MLTGELNEIIRSLGVSDCVFTWTGDEAGLLHLLLDPPQKRVSAELLLHRLRGGLVPVPPVGHAREVPSLEPLAALSALHRCTDTRGICGIFSDGIFTPQCRGGLRF